MKPRAPRQRTADSGRLRRELMGLLFIFCGLLLMLSLASFDSRDPWMNHVVRGVKQVHNKAGLFGAHISGMLYDGLGFGAWGIPLVFCFLGARRILGGAPWAWWRWTGSMLLILCICIGGAARDLNLIDLFMSDILPGSGNISTHGGGVLGHFLYVSMVGWLSGTGTLFIWISVFLLSIQMITGISWLTLLAGGGVLIWEYCAQFAASLHEHHENRIIRREKSERAGALDKERPAMREQRADQSSVCERRENPRAGFSFRERLAALWPAQKPRKAAPLEVNSDMSFKDEDSEEGFRVLHSLPSEESQRVSSRRQPAEHDLAPPHEWTATAEEHPRIPVSEAAMSVVAARAFDESLFTTPVLVKQASAPVAEEPPLAVPAPLAGYPASPSPELMQPEQLMPEAFIEKTRHSLAAASTLPESYFDAAEDEDVPPWVRDFEEDRLGVPQGRGIPGPSSFVMNDPDTVRGTDDSVAEDLDRTDSEDRLTPLFPAAPAWADYAEVMEPTTQEFPVQALTHHAPPDSVSPILANPVNTPESSLCPPSGEFSRPDSFAGAAALATPVRAYAAPADTSTPGYMAHETHEVSKHTAPAVSFGQGSVSSEAAFTPSPAATPESVRAIPRKPNISVTLTYAPSSGGQKPAISASSTESPERLSVSPIPVFEQTMGQQTTEVKTEMPQRLPLIKKPLVLPLPSLELIEAAAAAVGGTPRSVLEDKGRSLMTCLSDFGIQGELVGITPGPVVTMFELRPAPGVRVSRIANLNDDLALALKAVAVRIQAPIPGTDTVGIEIPNEVRETVCLKELLGSQVFQSSKSLLTLALGKDISGNPAVADLATMPHLLVAGATGAGKSVGINSIILSLLYKARPDEVKLLLVDPKRVEMAIYADLPHLVHPVVTEMQLAKNALEWAVTEMERRYSAIAKAGVRNVLDYNIKIAAFEGNPPPGMEELEVLPYLVIVIDELADLMLVAAKEVETSIVRLAQLARAAGIHLILATQRPSVDVVTGLIKANFPCRISFQVTSKHDSRTILDTAGAEQLLGKGDMLFKPAGGRFKRMHGAFVSDKNVNSVVDYWRSMQRPDYQVDFVDWAPDPGPGVFTQGGSSGDIVSDPMYSEAVEFVMQQGKASISLIQRKFRIGFNKAARYIEQMEQDGILGPADGSKPRMLIR